MSLFLIIRTYGKTLKATDCPKAMFTCKRIFFSGVLCFIYFEIRMSISATIMIQTYLNKMFHVNALYLYQFIGDFECFMFSSLLVCFFFFRKVHASLFFASAPVESLVFNKSGWRRYATSCKSFTQNPQIHLLLTNVTGVSSLLCKYRSSEFMQLFRVQK